MIKVYNTTLLPVYTLNGLFLSCKSDLGYSHIKGSLQAQGEHRLHIRHDQCPGQAQPTGDKVSIIMPQWAETGGHMVVSLSILLECILAD